MKSTKAQILLIWSITIIVTLGSLSYQRVTGPTYPVRGKLEMNGVEITYKLLRSHDTTGDAQINISVPDTSIRGEYVWRRFKSHDQWTTVPLERDGHNLIARIPKQPAAGKVMYRIGLSPGKGGLVYLTEKPVIIRFKGHVPLFILIPHIIFIFTAMLLATRAGLEAYLRRQKIFNYALATTIFLFIGGLILGPIVQKFAFNAYWTGWPFGSDLTDNKLAISFMFWLIALWQNWGQREKRIWVIVAALVQLLIFLIPHSMLGSEIDYTRTGPQ